MKRGGVILLSVAEGGGPSVGDGGAGGMALRSSDVVDAGFPESSSQDVTDDAGVVSAEEIEVWTGTAGEGRLGTGGADAGERNR